MGINSPQVAHISHRRQRLGKLCCRWVPRGASGAHNAARGQWSLGMVRRFDRKSCRRVRDVAAGCDTTWIHPCISERECWWVVRVFPKDDPPVARKFAARMWWSVNVGRFALRIRPCYDSCARRSTRCATVRGFTLSFGEASSRTVYLETVEFLRESGA